MSEKCVAVISGGLDSVTMLHELKRRMYEVYSISVYYGQKHNKELIFAEYWSSKLCKSWTVIELDYPELFGSSALTNSKTDVPTGDYTVETQKITVVPNRNMILLSFAIALADAKSAKNVFIAVHSSDRAVYPDCRVEFIDALSSASELGTYTGVKVVAPFINMKKFEIVKLGSELGVDFTKTWSCYKGGKIHCGVCGTCRERILAFKGAGVKDPTIYEVEEVM